MKLSECCGASPWYQTDVCSECKEHTDFYDDEGEPEVDNSTDGMGVIVWVFMAVLLLAALFGGMELQKLTGWL